MSVFILFSSSYLIFNSDFIEEIHNHITSNFSVDEHSGWHWHILRWVCLRLEVTLCKRNLKLLSLSFLLLQLFFLQCYEMTRQKPHTDVVVAAESLQSWSASLPRDAQNLLSTGKKDKILNWWQGRKNKCE